MSGHIVVGMDESASAAAALAWAASEARLRGAELVVCSVVERRLGHNVDVSDSAATVVLDESAAGYPTTVLTRHGEAAEELLAASDDADLLVVGSRGRGRLAGFVLGSVSRACMTHARCPVVVVGHPSATLPVGRVIAGVDGSPHARAALLIAAQEAWLRGATLHVLHAVYWDNIGTELITPTPEQLLEWGHKLVADELAATGVDGGAGCRCRAPRRGTGAAQRGRGPTRPRYPRTQPRNQPSARLCQRALRPTCAMPGPGHASRPPTS